jgi:hypothetical protein
VYRPRRPRESPLFRLVEQHLEELLRAWPQRFARTHDPLRPVVERVLREFLKCGLLEHGFARSWCSRCRRSVLVALSCRGRSLCPSCEKKKQVLWAEWLREELLAPVAHRHIVLTIPRRLRPLFRRRRELLTQLARAGAEAAAKLVPAAPVTTSDPASSSVTVFLYRAGPWRRLSWLAPRGLGDTVRQGEVGDMRSRPRSGWATGGAGPARQPLLERAPPAARPLLPGQQALSRRARRQDGGNAEVRVYLSWDLGDTRRQYRDD